MELILNNIEIIADDIKTYLNGSMHILDDKIVDINHLKKDIKTIDMHGLIIMPLAFNKLDINSYSYNKNIEDIRLDKPKVIKIDHNSTFDIYKPKLLNYVFYDKPYVLLDIDNLDLETVYFLIKNIDKDKLIITSEINKVLKLDISLNDIVAYCTLNVYRLLDYKYQYGRILKGNKASFMILDSDRNIILKIIEGKYE